MQIDYNKLELVDYEGAGNRTPVLDIGEIPEISELNPVLGREELQKNIEFRIWLKKEGLAHKADSVMIYYQARNKNYDVVTFIGEPNGSLENEFSEMCGNGIRSLALHIVLSEKNPKKLKRYIKNGIKILAGSIRTIRVNDVDIKGMSGNFSVNLGKIQTSLKSLDPYINYSYFRKTKNLSKVSVSDFATKHLRNRNFGIGFNGEKIGEPHLVLVNNLNEYLDLVKIFNLSEKLDRNIIINNLRIMVSLLGKEISYPSKIFPKGINFNLALVLDDKIFISTHERNMSLGVKYCDKQITQTGVCICNTMTCGTGGSIVCAIAKTQGYLNRDVFQTIHAGGDLFYRIKNNESIMTGPAVRISNLEDQLLPQNFLLETN